MEIKRPFAEADWIATPIPVRQYIQQLEQNILQLTALVTQLKERVEKLEQRTKSNSQNSNQPPSADAPFNKPERKKKKSKRKRGGQKGHKGNRQLLLKPTKVVAVKPSQCICGGHKIANMKPFYTHQFIELPQIQLQVTHFVLHKGRCNQCGKDVSGNLGNEHRFGYGPKISALIAELSGMQGTSRTAVQQFLGSVFNLPICTGAIQKVIDRVSQAMIPAYDKTAQIARSSKVGYIDETSWFKAGVLHWLWVMVTDKVAFYLIHPKRSREAFYQLIQTWQGILVSDNFRVYQHWVHKRQNCLAHFIRKAKKLAECDDEQLSSFGEQMLTQLQLLCHFANAPPGPQKWKNFYSRFLLLLMLHEGAENEAGKLARSLAKVMDTLWLFLEEHGVEPTNNRSERALRFGVIWRKRCFGSQSDKGHRWVERILSLRETCRLKGKASFPVLADLVQAYFKEQQPDLAWIS